MLFIYLYIDCHYLKNKIKYLFLMDFTSQRVISAGKAGLTGIASQYGLHDSIESGFQLSITKKLEPKHPLEDSTSLMDSRQSFQSVNLMQTMETKILSGISRLPGLPSSKLSLSILNNSIETIEVQDFLNCIFIFCSLINPLVPSDSPYY